MDPFLHFGKYKKASGGVIVTSIDQNVGQNYQVDFDRIQPQNFIERKNFQNSIQIPRKELWSNSSNYKQVIPMATKAKKTNPFGRQTWWKEFLTQNKVPSQP